MEKIVDGEMKRRDNSLDQQLKQAKEHAKSGDSAGAIPLYRAVLDQKCLFPKRAKDAAKELKKLGVNDVGDIRTLRTSLPLSSMPQKAPRSSAPCCAD